MLIEIAQHSFGGTFSSFRCLSKGRHQNLTENLYLDSAKIALLTPPPSIFTAEFPSDLIGEIPYMLLGNL